MIKDKIALVTGASKGFGAALSVLLAAKGYHVLLLSKQKKTLQETDDKIRAIGGNATIIPFDLRQTQLIDALIISIANRFSTLDLLVLNAAYLGQLRPLTHITDEGWSDCLSVNLTAHFKLLRGLKPLLLNAGKSEVVFVNDPIHEDTKPFWGAYAISKSAFKTMGQMFKAETENLGVIKTHLFSPNPMHTFLRNKAFPGEDPGLLAHPEDEARRLLNQMAMIDLKAA